MGVFRHMDAGYEKAIEMANQFNINI
jgi:urocanate hydratase